MTLVNKQANSWPWKIVNLQKVAHGQFTSRCYCICCNYRCVRHDTQIMPYPVSDILKYCLIISVNVSVDLYKWSITCENGLLHATLANVHRYGYCVLQCKKTKFKNSKKKLELKNWIHSTAVWYISPMGDINSAFLLSTTE